MRELPEQQTPTTFAEFFGQELRRYRKGAGLSLQQLGEKLNYSHGFIGLIEQAKRSCPRDVAERADTELDARGALLNLWAVANEEAHPLWFQPYVRAEAEATGINEWQPQLISGLLQTREYATEVLRAFRPEATDKEIYQGIEARMSRRAVLERDEPPRFWLILSEAALRTVVGSPALMAKQLAEVLKAAERPRVTVQVMPFTAGAHAATSGLLVVFDGPHRVAFCEGHASGRLITDAEEVAECAHAFSLLQSRALSVPDSVDLIRDVMEGYGS